jgi:alpha-glucoside transport system substrate-binding protein
MAILDRQQWGRVDQLVEDYTLRGLNRRQFLQRATALGLSLSVTGTLLEACGTSNNTLAPTTLEVLNVWSGEEQDSFKAMVEPFIEQNGIKVQVESTRDLNALLTTRLRGSNPPDIAILPNPGKMQELASQGKLIALDSFLDMDQIRNDYTQTWLDLGSYQGKLHAIFIKAANKGTIWYNPAQFQANHYQVPTDWQGLITLSNTISASGKYPWAMGVFSGAASGWPAADWITEIFLNLNGGSLYDQWVNHQIPWTHEAVKNAFIYFGQIVGGNHYIQGAPQSILATSFQDASYAAFQSPPTAYMYYLGDFTEGFITTQFTDAKPSTDFNFFPFPTITPLYKGAVTGGADVVVAMRDNNAVRKLVAYLASAQAQEIWVRRGGFTSLNRSVNLAAYPDPVAQASARMLTQASLFRFGADDLMPSQVEDAFWKGAIDFIQNQARLDSILSSIESTAQHAYGS